MMRTKAVAAVALAALVISTPAFAQRSRGGGGGGGGSRGAARPSGPAVARAVPRGSVNGYPARGGYYPARGGYYRAYPYYRPYYYGYGGYRYGYGYGPYGYGPGLSFNLYYGFPGYYFGYGSPWFYGGVGYGYGFGYGAAYGGYGYPGGYVAAAPGAAYGGVRIDLPQRDAEVYADGYYAGTVDDFDGAMQHLNLSPGAHRIEIRADGFAPLAFDIRVEPGRTVTYRTELRH